MAYPDTIKDPSSECDVGELVRRLETNYVEGMTTTSKYVQKSMYEDLQKIDAYLNSKHTTGEYDSLGREKPFFNIVTAAVNIWYRATDLDRSHIKIRPTKESDTFKAFFATVHLQEWMRKARFGYFLNDWGRTLARYGSAVVKFVVQDGELKAMVVPWNRVICDVISFENNPKIEVLELTEAELRSRKGYDQKIINNLCDAKTTRALLSRENQDENNDYIRLYEVHGLMPLSYLTGKEDDEYEYVQQMHVISYVAGKDKGTFNDFTLYSGKEEKDPYMITHLIREDGQTLSIGAVQHLFDAQWMMNHSVKAIKDHLDLSSKLIFQTADGSFIGMNALTAIETGDILIHKENMPLTQLNNSSHDVGTIQSFGIMWKNLGNEINGISDGMLGNAAPSGTPWRAVDALLQENHSLFELMTENKGLHVEDMLRIHVIPFLKKKMDTTDEVVATLKEYDLNRIDAKFVTATATDITNRIMAKSIANGETPTVGDQADLMQRATQSAQGGLAANGNVRYFSPSNQPNVTWKKIFKGMEWDLEFDITHESSSAKDDGTTLVTVLQTIANPATRSVLQTPEGKLLFNKILNNYGSVSPLELSGLPSANLNPTSIPSPVLTAAPATPPSPAGP